MKSQTRKLPKGQSYPLKPSALEAALTTAGISIDTELIRSPAIIFDAYFWPPNPNVPYERLFVRIGYVPSEQAQAARDRMDREALPALITWICNILAQDPKSPIRSEQQRLDLKIF